MIPAVASPAAVSRSTTTTLAPLPAKASAVARPMPFPAPVISATLPVKSRSMVSALRWNEHVAYPAHRADRLGMGRVDLDLAAQPGDAQVDGAIERVGLAVRGDLQQPVAHQGPVRVLGENPQQLEFARGQ